MEMKYIDEMVLRFVSFRLRCGDGDGEWEMRVLFFLGWI